MMGQFRGNARPGLFGSQAALPSAVNVPMPEQQRPGLGTRMLGQGWEGKIGALGAMLMGDRNAVQRYQLTQQQQKQALEQRAYEQRQAAIERDIEWQDWQRRQQYEAANPGPTTAERTFNWYQGLSPQQQRQYQQMRPEYRQGPDGRFYRVDIADMPTFTQDDWDNAGGTAGNSGGGFRP